MDENSIMWLVLVAISTIITLFKTVGQPILKLNASIIEATMRSEQAIEKLSKLEQSIDTIETKNHASRTRIHDRINNVEDRVDGLDHRVSFLENK